MRDVLLFMMVTVDGYVEGPDGDLSWHNTGPAFDEFAIAQVRSVDTILLGRLTYELFASYWTTPQAFEGSPDMARALNSTPKVVLSRTMRDATWNNTTVMSGEAADAVAALRERPGGDLLILGSGRLATSLARCGRIDEFRLMVNPVAIGHGTPLFVDLPAPLDLALVATRPFTDGNVLVTYHPRR